MQITVFLGFFLCFCFSFKSNFSAYLPRSLSPSHSLSLPFYLSLAIFSYLLPKNLLRANFRFCHSSRAPHQRTLRQRPGEVCSGFFTVPLGVHRRRTRRLYRYNIKSRCARTSTHPVMIVILRLVQRFTLRVVVTHFFRGVAWNSTTRTPRRIRK